MEDTYVPLAGSAPREFDDRLLRGIDAGLSLALEKRPPSIAAWWALPREVPADSAPTLVMPPAPRGPARHLAPLAARRGWLALGVGFVLAAMAGAYVTFAPTPTPRGSRLASSRPTRTSHRRGGDGNRVEPLDDGPAAHPARADRARLRHTRFGRHLRSALARDDRGLAAGAEASATGYLTAPKARRCATPVRHRRDRQPTGRCRRPGPAASSGVAVGIGDRGGAAPLAPVEADLRLAGHQLTGRIVHPVCGSLPVSLAVDAAGTVSGSLRLPEAAGCTTNAASASGRLSAAR
jgi:hypothetical protein